MSSIILVVISIALMAALASITINQVPADAMLRQQLFKEAQAGLQSIEQGVVRYLTTLPRDTEGNILYLADGVNLVPLFTPGVNLVPLFTPNFGYLPANVRKEMTWEVVTGTMAVDMPAVSICLRPVGETTAAQQTTVAELRSRLPVGSAFVSTGCQATTDTSGGTHLTYWLPISHIN